ncbi:MAG: hypothetical protein ACYSW3_18275 [Planctomycetota bacterium]|jgi:hypothetical protein
MMKSQIFVDEKTGNVYNLVPEKSWDIAAATFSIIYLVVMLGVFSVLLFAILSNQYLQEDNPIYKLMAYTVIGGGLGGIINGIRSFIGWHADRRAFGRRYIWKYITLPLLGAVLAAMVYAFFRSGFVAFGGNFAPELPLVGTLLQMIILLIRHSGHFLLVRSPVMVLTGSSNGLKNRSTNYSN